MCRIAGLVGVCDEQHLQAMSDATIHQGPDEALLRCQPSAWMSYDIASETIKRAQFAINSKAWCGRGGGFSIRRIFRIGVLATTKWHWGVPALTHVFFTK